MNRIFSFCLILVSSFSFLVSPVRADDEIRKMTVDVKLKGFSQSEYRDNLESKDIIFAPNDRLQLELKIKNEGNRNQTNIKVIPKVPSSVTLDTLPFTINQLTPGETLTKNITINIKDKAYVLKSLSSNTIRFDINTDVGSQAGDFGTFYTGGGTKGATVAKDPNTPTLPATGPDILFGSAISSVLGLFALKARKAIRGY